MLQIACGARLSAVIDRVGRRPAALWGIVGLGAGLACLQRARRRRERERRERREGGGLSLRLRLRRRGKVDRCGGHTHLPVEFQLFVGPRAVRGGGGGVSERGAREARRRRRRRSGARTRSSRGVFSPLVGALGPTRTWCAYLAVCVAAWFAVRAVLPETKGRSLESMGEEEERDNRGREVDD